MAQKQGNTPTNGVEGVGVARDLRAHEQCLPMHHAGLSFIMVCHDSHFGSKMVLGTSINSHPPFTPPLPKRGQGFAYRQPSVGVGDLQGFRGSPATPPPPPQTSQSADCHTTSQKDTWSRSVCILQCQQVRVTAQCNAVPCSHHRTASQTAWC